ncbi:hypothetical protein N7539_001495 [Penicillium diatomitis]|uniref:LysM domain-containing protein n=1 Tax=Penicillium diatomitis TaxID=2819901 RepID=A0A9W9XH20_9EURO|nr:uncharacterized protein N7539_001495 [Penicillium diatomitis]KAJ5492749.1 hypothetical protein N7539_001495 [Penicillium diatomitis]
MVAFRRYSCGLLALWAFVLAFAAIASADSVFGHQKPQSADFAGSVDHNETLLYARGSTALCKVYVTQSGDNCDSIAKKNGISVAQLTSFNARSWRFNCAALPQGATICIGPGEPPMPTAKGDAVCGPLMPGSMRPDNWADLASINPCPKDKCCTVDGFCVSPSGNKCTSQDQACVSNCQLGAPKAPNPPPAAKPTVNIPVLPFAKPNPKERTTMTKFPITTAPGITTAPAITTAPGTTKNVPKPPSTTSKKSEVASVTSVNGPAWTLVAYTSTICDGEYYVIRGHADMDKKCIDLPGDYYTGADEVAGVYCKHFTDGGFRSGSCATGITRTIYSWNLRGGVCTASDSSCEDGGGRSFQIDAYDGGCQIDYSAEHVELKWRSIRCQLL